MTNEDVVKRLDTVIALLRLVHHESLEVALTNLKSDKVNNEILKQVGPDWVGTKNLQDVVAKKADTSTRTVRDRLVELVKVGLIERRGGGTTTEYRAGDVF